MSGCGFDSSQTGYDPRFSQMSFISWKPEHFLWSSHSLQVSATDDPRWAAMKLITAKVHTDLRGRSQLFFIVLFFPQP